jgi:hypothetical protein
MTEQVPDSASFAMLRKLHAEKADRIDFSNPQLSHDIGDLAFLVGLFVREKAQPEAHQVVFLADMLVTALRQGFQARADKALKEGGPVEAIALYTKLSTNFRIAEAILDGVMSKLMQEGGFKGTNPSYKLVKSMAPDVRPHEVDDWIKGLGDIFAS